MRPLRPELLAQAGSKSQKVKPDDLQLFSLMHEFLQEFIAANGLSVTGFGSGFYMEDNTFRHRYSTEFGHVTIRLALGDDAP